VAGEGAFQVGLLVSHHGERAIRGQLVWGWTNDCLDGVIPIEVRPFETYGPVQIHVRLPEETKKGRLQVRLLSEDQQCRAQGELNVAR
jgi:hypothetical protein